jgi:hypothetical protein
MSEDVLLFNIRYPTEQGIMGKHYVSLHNFQNDGDICSSDTYMFESSREEKPGVPYYHVTDVSDVTKCCQQQIPLRLLGMSNLIHH